MTGRQKVAGLYADIANADEALSATLGYLERKQQELKLYSDNNVQHVAHAAIEAFRVQAEQSHQVAKIKFLKAKTNADALIAEVNKIDKDSLNFLVSPLKATECESLDEVKKLVECKAQIDAIYAQVGFEIYGELDNIKKDFVVVEKVVSAFDNAQSHQFGICSAETEKNTDGVNVGGAVEKFHEALDDLFGRAGDKFARNDKAGLEMGVKLMVLGIGLMMAALLIACPPAGAVSLSLLIGGGLLTAAGGMTLFAKVRNMINDPLRQIGDAMNDEEKRVKSLS